MEMEIQNLETIELYERHNEVNGVIFEHYDLYSDKMNLNLFQNYSIEYNRECLGIAQLISMKVLCAERISKHFLAYLYGLEEDGLNSVCSLSKVRTAFYRELKKRFSSSLLYQKGATRLSIQFYLWITMRTPKSIFWISPFFDLREVLK